jgi:peptidoglycan/xylan/chitin deacetylase (PgdA/CDA1 family)
MHNRMVGKPGRIMALRRFMEYIRDKPDVWVTTRTEIAEHWREKYPYEKVGATFKLHNEALE